MKKKLQSVIVQFIIFFLVCVGVLVTFSNLFHIQLRITQKDILRENLKLITEESSQAMVYASITCKQCDYARITIFPPKKISNVHYKVETSSRGLETTSFSSRFNESWVSPVFNLNYTLSLQPEEWYSGRNLTLIFQRRNYKLWIG